MKIRIGYDGSPSAQDAPQDLARAGLPRKARVRVISALNPWMPPDFLSTREPGMKAWYSAAYARALAEAEATEGRARKLGGRAADILRRFHPGWSIAVEPALGMPDHARLEKAGLSATTAMIPGEPREVLPREARSCKAVALFMGSRGLSGFRRLLLGSVSSSLAAHAPCTVEIIRIKERNP